MSGARAALARRRLQGRYAAVLSGPTGIGKTMSALFPALKAMGEGGKSFYLTARNTTQAAAEDAWPGCMRPEPELALRSVTLTAKEKVCLQDAAGVYRRKPAPTPTATTTASRMRWRICWTRRHPDRATPWPELARRHRVCPLSWGWI